MEETKKLLTWIESKVFMLDPKKPDPGRVTIRRLNRNEYANAVFDLLGIEYDTAEAFLEISTAGKKLAEAALGWDQRRSIDLAANVKMEKGERTIKVTLKPEKSPAAGEEALYLRLQRLIVQEPLDGSQREFSKGHRMIFVDGPAPEDPKAANAYARKIMRSFVSRAFRRPVVESDITRLVAILNEIDKLPGKSFQDGIKQAIAVCLASPRFLFRAEIQPEPNNRQKSSRSTNTPSPRACPFSCGHPSPMTNYYLWRTTRNSAPTSANR